MSLADDLKRDEGFKANPYLDTATPPKLTFGHGRNLEANPLTGAEWRHLFDSGDIAVSISPQGAEWLMLAGLTDAERQCAFTFKWWTRLDPVRRDVVVNLCFNMGMPRLLGFRNMLAALDAGDFNVAADELQDSEWFREVKKRGPLLVEQLRKGVRA